jgi:hypothetical protein
MEQTIIHASTSGTVRIAQNLDSDRELCLSITTEHGEHCTYLSEDEITDLRDRLTVLLERAVQFSYEIYQYKDCIRWSISQGSVDNFGLKVLSDSLPPGFYITYDKI